MNQQYVPKFRPYLSASAMDRIMSLIPPNSMHHTDKEIAKSLAPMLAKVMFQVASPAYISNPLPSLEEKLGFEENKADDEFKKLQEQLNIGVK